MPCVQFVRRLSLTNRHGSVWIFSRTPKIPQNPNGLIVPIDPAIDVLEARRRARELPAG